MKKDVIQIFALGLYMVVGIVLFVLGILKNETILLSPGLVMILMGIRSFISLWKLHKGDKNELDKYRAAKDERILMIWDKAAFVSFFVAFISLLTTAFIYLVVLDMFLEGLVVLGILIAVLTSYVIAVWYYSKRL